MSNQFEVEEVREVSATGGAKGVKPAMLGDIAPEALYELAEIAGFGRDKYDAYNYLKGMPFSSLYNAMNRHLMQFWSGEDRDSESGKLHVLHAAWHCLALAAFIQRGIGTDDRPTQEYLQKLIDASNGFYEFETIYLSDDDDYLHTWEEN